MDIKKAKNIIDKMYQDKMNIREKQTEEGLEIDLSKQINFTELEEASIILLRNYLKLKRKNEEKDKQIDLMAEHIVSSAIVDDTVCAIKCDCESDILEDCSHEKMLNCTKQYFETKAKKGE